MSVMNWDWWVRLMSMGQHARHSVDASSLVGTDGTDSTASDEAVGLDKLEQALAYPMLGIVSRLGPDFKYLYLSPDCAELFGHPAAAMLGRNALDFVHPDDRDMLKAFSNEPDRETGKQKSIIYRVVREDQHVVWIESTGRIVSTTGEHIIVHRALADKVVFDQVSMAEANRDDLTHLTNRRGFDCVFEHEWARTAAEGGTMSLLLGDVDYFKVYNNWYGHQDGDKCLRALADAITSALGHNGDMAARYEGEEIAIILPNVDHAGAQRIAERLRRTVEYLAIPHVAAPGTSQRVSISFGVATVLEGAASKSTPEALLKAADAALHRAKHAGRNCVSSTVLLEPVMARV